MWKTSRQGILAFLIVAAFVALVLTAVSTTGSPRLKDAARKTPLPVRPRGPRSASPAMRSLPKSYACPQCGSRIGWGSEACPRCGWALENLMRHARMPDRLVGLRPARAPVAPAANRPAAPAIADAAPVGNAALPAAGSAPASTLPSPRDQNAAKKAFVEGHWLGLEVISVTPELAKEYGVRKDEMGVLVDEVTLEAAESGLLAGDLVQSVNGNPTADLKAFFLATQRVREERQAKVSVSRRGEKKTLVLAARNTEEMGTAQMEAAQPIMPGAISPHRSRGRPCTDCHVIMKTGGQLPTDAGDILPTPPPIAADARAPHGSRGRCSTCHVIR